MLAMLSQDQEVARLNFQTVAPPAAIRLDVAERVGALLWTANETTAEERRG